MPTKRVRYFVLIQFRTPLIKLWLLCSLLLAQYSFHPESVFCLQPDVVTYNFNWVVDGVNYYKEISGHFIQSSPEVEIALYTLCYMTRRNQNCHVDLVEGHMDIVNWDYQGTDQIGTVYPACSDHN